MDYTYCKTDPHKDLMMFEESLLWRLYNVMKSYDDSNQKELNNKYLQLLRDYDGLLDLCYNDYVKKMIGIFIQENRDVVNTDGFESFCYSVGSREWLLYKKMERIEARQRDLLKAYETYSLYHWPTRHKEESLLGELWDTISWPFKGML